MNGVFRILFAICLVLSSLSIRGQVVNANDKIVGMYIHQHWSYNHPYAARTWTFDDWIGYLGGIRRLGYNTVVIWPMLEIMPNPLTHSDSLYLSKIADVIQTAQAKYQMRVYLVVCPNVSARNEEASKYTFEKRPFFQTDDRVDPADPIVLGELMEQREALLRPLARADGLFLIDSDPGGYPHSTNLEYVYLLGAYRRVLDRLRPDMELYYWTHFGWEAYSRFYADGRLKVAAQDEIREVIRLLLKQGYEPWGITGSRYENDIVEIAKSVKMEDRVLTFKYGAIEREPSFPFTLYNCDTTYRSGLDIGERGIIGNAQTHCVQLPNTFLFARAALGLPAEKADFIAFANELVPGYGELIVEGWEALQSDNPQHMNQVADRLSDAIHKANFHAGPLSGLIFGDPSRFIRDLALQLNAMGSICRFVAIVNEQPVTSRGVKDALATLIQSFEAWQRVHGFSGNPRSPHIPGKMEELMIALTKLNNKELSDLLTRRDIENIPGESGFGKARKYLQEMETFTPKLIVAMKHALNDG